MIPSPRRTASQPNTSSWHDFDDDDGWQDMPVVRSDDNPFGLDDEDQKKYHYKPPARIDSTDGIDQPTTSGNATGTHLELEADTLATDSWREKAQQDESDYTRLRLDEDEESEEVHMRTRYLFNEDKAMTPLSQMQATKEILTEGQRIAYVGLCQLIARRMVKDSGRGWEGVKVKTLDKLKGKGKNEVPVVESANIWMLKIMARLYQHMEVLREEQRMIESLAEHGVDPSDLVPALMTTHTVKNPEFDPNARKQAEVEAEKQKLAGEQDDLSDTETEAPPPPYEASPNAAATSSSSAPGEESPPLSSDDRYIPPPSIPKRQSPRQKSINPFGSDDEEEEVPSPPTASSSTSSSVRPAAIRSPSFDLEGDDDDGDIGRIASPVKNRTPTTEIPEDEGDIGGALSPIKSASSPLHIEHPSSLSLTTTTPPSVTITQPDDPLRDPEKTPQNAEIPLPEEDEDNFQNTTLPSLPGVSTSLTNADEMVTLDIRWTVLCDLFLVLIADSIYDARSRHFLERIAEALGFGWLDVVRFENRVTDALEIQEGMEKTEQGGIIEGRRKTALRKRYAMMGLAAVGGGLVIGLSAGLMAPLIGAGLAGALGTIGIGGTTGFLAGAGGAAVITTGGVLTGANIAGRGMARRTREVRTFELKPLHNNKRVACYITIGGFMSGKYDDVRLPFSVIDPIVGDVLSVFWEPEMMHEMGNALKILTSEVLTQVGQTVLQATVMAALMTALQWPIILSKLGYLIDNPWSNALDRSRAAGLVLADTIIHRHAGVRPISLIGFSLGARTIFYALLELARVKAYGLVQDVFLFGTTVTASRQTWLEVRSAVSGRFVNGFASNDWMLGYLFRATSGGLNTVAGLRPVEVVPGLENIEVTDLITGHMSYRSCMPQLLAKVGFPVTAEFFDEPEDPDNVDMTVQERTVVNEEEEEAKRNRKKILGLFPRRDKSSGSGTSTPNPASRRVSSGGKSPKADEYDEDADDLPPREGEDDGDIGGTSISTIEADAVALEKKRREEKDKEAEVLAAIPKTAGFDFQAISKALGKDIDLENLKEPDPKDHPPPIPVLQLPLERSGSAPPPVQITPEYTAQLRDDEIPRMARSASFALTSQENEDDEGDITFGSTSSQSQLSQTSGGGREMSLGDLPLPSWDKPSVPLASPVTSPPLNGGEGKSPGSASSSSFNFGFNAWSSNATPTASGFPMRSAPPARPHPPEFMANPFATNGTGNGTAKGGEKDPWGARKKDEELATANPW